MQRLQAIGRGCGQRGGGVNFIREIAQLIFWHLRRCASLMMVCLKEIVRAAQDRYYDRRFGIHTCGEDDKLEERSLFKDEILYRPTSFHRILIMTDYLKLKPKDVFVDLGCGKGRALALVARERLKKVIGLELKRSLADVAQKNANHLKHADTEVEVVQGDAITFDVREGTVFFMYHPFMYKTFTKVLQNIRESVNLNPRKIRIVYFDPCYAEVLDNEDWLVREGEIGHTKIVVWGNISPPYEGGARGG
ncbi:MAG: hypothetical protein AUJ71_02605 [Candidatus Omnitrophica bacterium CG1_02_49_16]|nr:MAG: hypothetical protein AUJ71_02605 [Candidatus Omnitrophica bacterium CG1_02_49_16]